MSYAIYLSRNIHDTDTTKFSNKLKLFMLNDMHLMYSDINRGNIN